MGGDPIPGVHEFFRLLYKFPDLTDEELEELRVWLRKIKKPRKKRK